MAQDGEPYKGAWYYFNIGTLLLIFNKMNSAKYCVTFCLGDDSFRREILSKYSSIIDYPGSSCYTEVLKRNNYSF